MDQSATNQFRAALTFLLKKEGRGAQTRLAKKQNIDRGYLNAIVKGRKPGSEKKRGEIAAYFGIDYEDMLSLGRRILNGEENPELFLETRDGKTDIPECDGLDTSKNENHNLDISKKSGSGAGSIPEKLVSVVEVLEGDAGFSDLLAALIDAFHDSVKTKKENLSLEEELQELKDENSKLNDQMEALESRLASLEACSDDEKGGFRKTA